MRHRIPASQSLNLPIETNAAKRNTMSFKSCVNNLRVLISVFVILGIFGCASNDKPSLENSAAFTEKTLILALVSPDDYLSIRDFNRWNSFKKTQGLVHVFADEMQTIATFDAYKHNVNETRLPQEMTKVLSENDSERLIIFVSTHGAQSGNWCYKNQSQCTLTEDTLVDVLATHAQNPQQRLKQVLIVSSSCYSKTITDRFAAKVNQQTWPFDISYVSQTVNESNTTQSPADSLVENLLIPIGDNLTDAELDTFFALSSIEEFIAFNNNLIPEAFKELRMALYSSSIHSSSILKLGDFGFNIGVSFSISLPQSTLFPMNKTVEQVLSKDTMLSNKFYDYVEEIEFNFDDMSSFRLIVNGDNSQNIFAPEQAHKKYKDLSIILRKSARK